MSPLGHDEIQALLGAFALDAVDDAERDLIEAHLAGCPRCRAEVATHRETAALLAHGGDTAPEGVWARITASLEEPPPEMSLAPVASIASARQERERRPEADGSPARRSITLRAASAAAAVAAALTAFFGWRLGQQDEHLDEVAAEMRELLAEDGLRRAADAAEAEPAAEAVRLASNDGRTGVKVVRLPDGTGFALADALEPLPADRSYQLWAVTADATISLGVLGPDPRVAPFHMTGPVLAYAITEEVAAGVTESAHAPVVIGWTELGEKAGQAPTG